MRAVRTMRGLVSKARRAVNGVVAKIVSCQIGFQLKPKGDSAKQRTIACVIIRNPPHVSCCAGSLIVPLVRPKLTIDYCILEQHSEAMCEYTACYTKHLAAEDPKLGFCHCGYPLQATLNGHQDETSLFGHRHPDTHISVNAWSNQGTSGSFTPGKWL